MLEETIESLTEYIKMNVQHAIERSSALSQVN